MRSDLNLSVLKHINAFLLVIVCLSGCGIDAEGNYVTEIDGLETASTANLYHLSAPSAPPHTQTVTPTATATPASETIPGRVYLNKVIPPCTLITKPGIDPCALRPRQIPSTVYLFDFIRPEHHYRDSFDEARTRRFTAHIAFRGTGMPNTARCEQIPGFFHGYHLFSSGGFHDQTDYGPRIVCFVDMAVHEYIVGKGASVLTVAVYAQYTESVSGYRNRLLAAELFYEEGIKTWEEALDMVAAGWGSDISLEDLVAKDIEIIYTNYEWVFYINPSPLVGNETWSVNNAWHVVKRKHLEPYLEEAAASGYGSCKGDVCVVNQYERTVRGLSEFASATRRHHALLVEKHGGRIDDAAGATQLVLDSYQLRSFFNAVGAYDHPFVTPAPPPPVPGENDPYTPGTRVDDPPAGDATVTVPGALDDTPTDTPTPTATPTAIRNTP